MKKEKQKRNNYQHEMKKQQIWKFTTLEQALQSDILPLRKYMHNVCILVQICVEQRKQRNLIEAMKKQLL